MVEESETMQYLTFTLADEVIAVEGARVREILEMSSITNASPMPEFMRCVIDLRGCAVPIIDLRLKFSLQGTAKAENTCIMEVEVARDVESVVLGAQADSVQEVIEMEQSRINTAPHWLRCRISKNDFKQLYKIFIHAASTQQNPKEATHGSC